MSIIRFSKLVLFLFIVSCSGLVSGCGMIKSAGEKLSPTTLISKIKPRAAHLKKRIIVFDPVDQAGYGPETAAGISEVMKKSFEKNSRFIIQPPPQDLEWADADGGIDLGIAAPVEILDYCSQKGISTIVTLVLSPVENTPKTTGIWPFKSQSIVFSIPVRLTALDVASGTILHSSAVLEEKTMKLIDAEMSTDRELLNRFAERIKSDIVPQQVDELIENMDQHRWKGKILSFEEGRATINAGTDIGVEKGSRFEVLNEGIQVETKENRTLTVPGPVLGELVITVPGTQTSIAEPVDNRDFESGLYIRYKP
ncbi:MAG: hypothetical protein R6U13_12720 [Desulfatiglandaceae bacterium]